MRAPRTLWVLTMVLTMVLAAPVSGRAQGRPVANVTAADGTLIVTPLVAYDHLSLRVATPDGQLFQTDGDGGAVVFRPFAIAGYTPPEGSYIWEIQLTPRGAISPELRAQALRARESGDVGAEQAFRVAARRATVVQSGGFWIVDGKLLAGGAAEPRGPARARSSGGVRLSPFGPASFAGDDLVQADQVIPDDLIVQGSACIGLDCVNNESLGFDTIRLKENNLRIKFEDTSVGSFPTNDWQLTANDSASGGASKFSIDDITNGKTPFTVLASAPTNSLFVDGSGRVGFRTGTPVLDLHAATGNTPALRFEQNGSSGFTAQTWDMAGNEANFFIRDVTGGSRLPFRIRPGAPTSSIDISSAGQVGIGTASPSQKLHVRETANVNTFMLAENACTGGSCLGAAGVLRAQSDTATANFQAHNSVRTISRFGQVLGGFAEFLQVSGNGLIIGTLGATPLVLGTNNANRVHILGNGNIGLRGNTAPDSPIHDGSGARLTAGGTWMNASSRELKQDIQRLTVGEAVGALQQLSPVKYVVKADPAERHVGFVAEDVPDLVAAKDRKTLSSMDIVAVLTRVVQEQQKTVEAQERLIAELAAKVAALEAAQRR